MGGGETLCRYPHRLLVRLHSKCGLIVPEDSMWHCWWLFCSESCRRVLVTSEHDTLLSAINSPIIPWGVGNTYGWAEA